MLGRIVPETGDVRWNHRKTPVEKDSEVVGRLAVFLGERNDKRT